jgi:hypothetical protein
MWTAIYDYDAQGNDKLIVILGRDAPDTDLAGYRISCRISDIRPDSRPFIRIFLVSGIRIDTR